MFTSNTNLRFIAILCLSYKHTFATQLMRLSLKIKICRPQMLNSHFSEAHICLIRLLLLLPLLLCCWCSTASACTKCRLFNRTGTVCVQTRSPANNKVDLIVYLKQPLKEISCARCRRLLNHTPVSRRQNN